RTEPESAGAAAGARGKVCQAIRVNATPRAANAHQIAGQPNASRGVNADAASPSPVPVLAQVWARPRTREPTVRPISWATPGETRPAPAPARTIPAANTTTPGAAAMSARPLEADAPARSTVPRADRRDVPGDTSNPMPYPAVDS